MNNAEIDRFLAEKVMGWLLDGDVYRLAKNDYIPGSKFQFPRGAKTAFKHDWSPSARWDHAGMCVDVALLEHRTIYFVVADRSVWIRDIYDKENGKGFHGATNAEALSRAIVKLYGGEV